MGKLARRLSKWLSPDLMSRGEVEALVAEKVLAARQALPISLDYDPKNEGYRRLTGVDGMLSRDLTPMGQDTMIELAYYLYDTSGLVKRFVRDSSNFVLGEGLTLDVKNDDEGTAKKWLEDFWEKNRLELRLRKRIEFLCLLGEQCWPVLVNPYNGRVMLGYIDPSNIDTVEVVTGFPEIPQRIVLKGATTGRGQSFAAIREDWDPMSRTTGRMVGECFFYSINNPPNGTRGRSDLIQSFDFINGLEESLFDEIDRIKLIKAFIWDVTLNGATDEEISDFLKKNRTPKAGSVRAHNDRVTWQAVAPDLKMQDSKTFLDFMKTYLAACQNRPDSWFGSGGKVYQSEAELNGEPTFKDLGTLQLFVRCMLEDVCRFVIDQAVIRGALRESKSDPLKPAVNMPEMVTRDLKAIVEALFQFAQALTVAESQGWLSKDTSTELFASVVVRCGFEIDAAEEIKKRAAEATDVDGLTEDYRKAKDPFTAEAQRAQRENLKPETRDLKPGESAGKAAA